MSVLKLDWMSAFLILPVVCSKLDLVLYKWLYSNGRKQLHNVYLGEMTVPHLLVLLTVQNWKSTGLRV